MAQVADEDDDGIGFAVFRSPTVREGETVEDDLVCMFCRIEVAGNVKGDVVALFGDVHVTGSVNGDVVACGGKIVVGPTAVLSGEAVAVGGGLDADPSARIGEESESLPFLHLPGQLHVFGMGVPILLFLCVLFGVLGSVLGVGRLGEDRSVRRVFRPYLSLITGGVLFCLAIAAITLSPDEVLWVEILVLVVMLLLCIAAVYGLLLLGSAAGSMVMPQRRVFTQGLVGGGLLGVLLVLPVLGLVVMVLGYLIALGAAVLLPAHRLAGRLRRKSEPAVS